jgi:hypothetical protein
LAHARRAGRASLARADARPGQAPRATSSAIWHSRRVSIGACARRRGRAARPGPARPIGRREVSAAQAGVEAEMTNRIPEPPTPRPPTEPLPLPDPEPPPTGPVPDPIPSPLPPPEPNPI